MLRWLHDMIARREPHRVRPRPGLLRPVPPSSFVFPENVDSHHLESLEAHIAQLRAEKAALQAQLTAAQAFPRFKP